MEQRAKLFWDEHHYGDPNPYADLPRMQILTFTLPKMLRDQAIENNEVFKFHEFFRVYTEEDKLQLQKLIDNEPNVIKKAEYQAELAKVKLTSSYTRRQLIASSINLWKNPTPASILSLQMYSVSTSAIPSGSCLV